MSEIKGAHILITGAAGALGRLLTGECLRLGAARLSLLDVDAKELQPIQNRAAASQTKVDIYSCDLTDSLQIAETAKRIQNTELPDILIHNAGLLTNKPFWECSDDVLANIITVNSTALFWLTKAFLPQMLLANKGHIVTVASAAGLAASAGLAAYPAAKFAAFGFNETIRRELKQLHSAIRTTVVCPFYIATPMVPGVQSRFPLLLPVLKPEKVTRAIVRAIRRNQKQLLMPRLLYTLPLLRLLPVSMFDAVLRFLGIHQAAKSITFNVEEK